MGRLTDKMLKDWLKNTNIADELVNEGLITQAKVDEIFYISPEQYIENHNKGMYSIDDIIRIVEKGGISQEKGKQLITNMYIKDIEDGILSIDQIKTISNLTKDEKFQLVADIHKKNINQQKYSKEKIEALVKNKELTEDDLQECLSAEQLKNFMPCILTVDFSKWEDMPPLQPNKTDIFVLGVPGSGKSTLMSGLLHYAKHNGLLNYNIKNHFGAKYMNQLASAVEDGCLIDRTSANVIQFMACDFIDSDEYKHPLSFIEMSGEVFEGIYNSDEVKIPERMREYVTSDNHKIIVLAIDYYDEINSIQASTKAKDKLEYSLKVLEKFNTLEKVDAILVVITKWDLNKDKSDDAAANFLTERGYKSLKRMCEDYSIDYNLEYTFQTFSLGNFYGINNQKYKYNPEYSEKIFNWFCKNTARLTDSNKRKQNKNQNKGFFSKIFKK